MSLVTAGLTPTTINHDETDSLLFVGVAPLTIAGPDGHTIYVTLSSVAGAGVDTTNISYADVTLGGPVGAGVLAHYNIGTGGTLRMQSTIGVNAVSSVSFTGTNSHLVIGSGVNLNLLSSGIAGFGPGSNIDLSGVGESSYTYVDNAGTGTGGTLTLRDGSGNTTGTVTLSTGEYTAASFNVHPDGGGGTLIDFATYVSTVTATPANADLTVGGRVALTLGTTAPVTVSGGPPTLTLSDGGTAVYDAASSTPTSLVFRHTVQPGQNTGDLTVTGVNANGASITDLVGAPVSLSGAVQNPPGTLQVDTTPPTITGVSTSPASGSVAAGQLVTINVTPSEAVTVTGGAPTLTLNDGGTATFDAARSTATNLVFDYTVQPGQNASHLSVIAANLNGAILADGAGNPGNLGGAVGSLPGTLQIDTTPPTVSVASTTPGSGSLGAGQTVAFAVTPSEAVTVAGGTPTLTLNDGGTATFDAARSTATNLVFDYTVAAGQNTADLTVTAANLNGATITDAAGNTGNLSGAVGNPAGTLQVDTTAPTIVSTTTSPGSGTVAAGQVVTFNVTPSEAVAVTGGVPSLALSDGGTATYDAADSTPTLLVFKYTVAPGDNSPDLAVTGASLNGATIADPAGNTLDLSAAVGNPPGTLVVNTAGPTVTSVSDVTATPNNGDLTTGGTVALQVALTGNATVTGGSPTLTLNDGGTATYDSLASTPTSLVFRYTVQSGQNTADLAVTGVSLNGATVRDTSGNNVDLSGAVRNPAGILQIDTTPPVITGVSTTPGGGSFRAGQVVALTVATNEPVTVTNGTPTLTLNDGGVATFDAANSTATSLVFDYTVQPGQNIPDLAVSGTNLNGASVTDGAGNPLALSAAVGNPPGTLQIDTTAPTVIAVATTPSSGVLTAGRVVAINVTPSEAVTVNGGTPTLTLNDGGVAVYDAANSTATNLVFDYTVQSGQNTADLTVTATNLNGAAITDGAGNPIDLSAAIGNPPGTLQVNTAPVVTSVVASPSNGDLTVGGTVVLQVNTSGPTTVSGGPPTLTLNDGGTATYDPIASSSTSLVFRYTVQPNQNTADLAVTSVALNGAVVSDGSGNPVDLSGAVGNPAGTLQIDTIAPVVTALTTTPTNAAVGVGQVVSIGVNTSEPVTVSGGTPTLTLNDGGTATYDAARSTATLLVFDYTVQPGQNTADLTVTGANPNGASITDGAGNALNLSGAIGNPAGTLQISAVPIVSSVVATPTNADLTIGGAIALQVNTNSPVTVTGGTPTLALNDGGTAVYDPASSTPTSLVFRNTVQAGQNTPDLAATAAFLNGATIADAAGQSLDLAGALGNPTGTLQVDTISPKAISFTMGGSVQPGGQYNLTFTYSEVVVKSGPDPIFFLANGSVARYNALLSQPNTSVFTYTVEPGDDTSPGGLSIVGFNPNGNVATDLAGNPLDESSVGQVIAAAQGTNLAPITPTTIDVYRFFDKNTGTHFYTQDQAERANVLATRPDLVPEGPNGVGLTAVNPASNDPNAVAVYRFFDTKQGTHFFTASSSERDAVIATRPDMVYEPSSTFYEHATPQAGDTAVYRFFDSKYGTHFYTDDPQERASIMQMRPDLVSEGIGFYEPARNPAA